MVLFFLCLPVVSQTTTSTFVDEPVRVQNYSRAPFLITILSASTRRTSDEFAETCFKYRITSRRSTEINNYSYQIGPAGKQPYVLGTSYDTPKPLDSMTQERCVANAVFVDEGHFLFRLTMVESNDRKRAIWESKDHRKSVRSFMMVSKRKKN